MPNKKSLRDGSTYRLESRSEVLKWNERIKKNYDKIKILVAQYTQTGLTQSKLFEKALITKLINFDGNH